MQVEFFTKIREGLSPSRLDSYGGDGAEEVIVLSRYLLNSALSEALYPLLQSLEICLRNEIDRVVSNEYGGDWITAPATFLNRKEIRQINRAKINLRKNKLPLSRDNLIAELSFGFWTTLLDVRYERALWQKLLGKSFRQMLKSERTRKKLSARFNRIRKLRNRIFHHGRIVHWKNLPQQHLEIIESIGWISPELRDMAEALDTFHEIYKDGLNPWIDKIRSHWPSSRRGTSRPRSR